jgi:hypothetical protein
MALAAFENGSKFDMFTSILQVYKGFTPAEMDAYIS